MNKYTVEEITDILDISVHSLSQQFMIILLKALSKLPKNVVDWTADNIYFISDCDCDAFYKDKKELKPWKSGIVFLSNNLKNKSFEEQLFTIAHEIAHAKMRHKAVAAPVNLNQKEHERKADELAKKWLHTI